MVPFLPSELLRSILSSLSIPSDLARCCLTSKTFLSIAQPLLFVKIKFVIFECLPDNDDSGVRYHLDESYDQLRATLNRNLHLRMFVKEVTITGAVTAQTLMEKLAGADFKYWQSSPEDLLQELDEILDRVEVVTIKSPFTVFARGSMDRVIHRLQNNARINPGRRTKVPKYSLDFIGSTWKEQTMLGAYTGLCCMADRTASNGIDIQCSFRASATTLRTLRTCLDDSTTLLLFRRLQQLSLKISVRRPSCIVQNLTNALTGTSSLRILAIHGLALKTDLTALLHPGVLARILPKSLVVLSLHFRPTSTEALIFLQDLPMTSSLKRFNCFGEIDEMEIVMEKFSQRGIGFSLNEDWINWW